MTDAQPTGDKTPTESTPKSGDSTPSQAQAPNVDMTAIAEKAADAAAKKAQELIEKRASEMSDKQLKALGKQLLGEKDKTPDEVILESLVNNPAKLISQVHDITRKQVLDEVSSQRARERTEDRVIGKFVSDYPELENDTKAFRYVEAQIPDYLAQGKSYEEALTASFEDVVKFKKLESVSASQRARGYSPLPGGGGVGGAAPTFNDEKSTSDYIASLQSRSKAVRNRKLN